MEDVGQGRKERKKKNLATILRIERQNVVHVVIGRDEETCKSTFLKVKCCARLCAIGLRVFSFLDWNSSIVAFSNEPHKTNDALSKPDKP